MGAYTAKVLTVSTRAASGERGDRTGPAVQEFLEKVGFQVVERRVISDGRGPVSEAVAELSRGFAGLVVTAGGTGMAPTDETPEGTLAVLDRQAPGIAEAMRRANPLGRLSRGVAGTVGDALVVNLPGSPAGAVECLEAVADVLPHALDLLAGEPAGH